MMEHTPAPQKSRELFFSSTQVCALKKIQVLALFNKFLPLFEVEWSKTIKFNYV